MLQCSIYKHIHTEVKNNMISLLTSLVNPKKFGWTDRDALAYAKIEYKNDTSWAYHQLVTKGSVE